MILEFTKMNGAGNDFLMIDNRQSNLSLNQSKIERLCNRHRGIGADGLITIEGTTGIPRMRYYNANGKEAEMCGNGARCFAKFASKILNHKEKIISFSTQAGNISAEVLNNKVKLLKSKISQPTPT